MQQYLLSTHATVRVLERSARAPQWLADLLAKGHFARLQHGGPERRVYALVFDVLDDCYLVAILSKKDPRVVTVLTQTQYENVHGAIPEVLLGLAKLARTQALAAEFPEPEPAPAKGPFTPWTSRWRVKLSLGAFRKRKIALALETPWRQNCIRRMCGLRIGVEPDLELQLDFPRQARLLASSTEFQAWLAETLRQRGEKLATLTTVALGSGHAANVRVDVTRQLSQHLAEESAMTAGFRALARNE